MSNRGVVQPGYFILLRVLTISLAVIWGWNLVELLELFSTLDLLHPQLCEFISFCCSAKYDGIAWL